MGKNLANKLHCRPLNEIDFSSEEFKKRVEKIVYKQKMIRKSIIYTPSDLQKVSFPPYHISSNNYNK